MVVSMRPERQIGALEQSTGRDSLSRAIGAARDVLINRQHAQGYWHFELEADCTIPAEYIMMMHYLDEIDAPLEKKICLYLRARQASHGGWPLYYDGAFDLSCSIKAYYALKLAGDDPDAPHMRRAREAILAHGGAARANVFTRIALALFGQLPWRGVPYIPIEIMLLPKWFPFHLDKVSYWSRTVMVPLFILCTRRPVARNPRGIGIAELFTIPAEQERDYFRPSKDRSGFLTGLFRLLDLAARGLDPLVPKALRARATRRAEQWILERLNGEDGLGAIFPAMVNALEALLEIGYASDDPHCLTARRALQKLLVVTNSEAYCQPCLSPIWDSALAALAMQETGDEQALAAADRALEWLAPQQLLEGPGDWRVRRPQLPGGGWPFQFGNGHYPDLDDTAAIAWSLHRGTDPSRYAQRLERALDWLVGMQSSDGGFAAFDVDNTYYYLNYIPFADHGALLDPPTSDVTARVITILALRGRPQDQLPMQRAIDFLRSEQEADGSWFGRWGTNYVYGTWSVLMALGAAGLDDTDPMVRRAIDWLVHTQNPDGGWGESNDTYQSSQSSPAVRFPSNAFQTAWAMLALTAVGQANCAAARSGVEYLLSVQQADGLWGDPHFTAPGFPRVFYLKYHGYCAYFPLWALAAYRKRAAAIAS